MLQWMGGSRKKVNASRKSMHNKQKHYFEQRKRLQQTTGLENYNDVNSKQVHFKEGSRSLDIQSFVNLATVAQRAIQPENLLPDKSSAANVLKNAPATQNLSSNVEGLRLPASSYALGSNATHFKSQQKQEDIKDEILVLDLLDDDNKEINCRERRAVPETHVSFSVSGLGKIGVETPAHSPRTQIRSFPPGVTRHRHNSTNPRSMPYDLGIELGGDMFDIKKIIDEDTAEVICKRKSTSYEKRNRKNIKFIDSYMDSDLLDDLSDGFGSCDESFQKSRSELWGPSNDLLDNDFPGTREYDAEWNKLSYPSRDAKMTQKHECGFRSFSLDSSRFGAKQQKISGNSAKEDPLFNFSELAEEFNFVPPDKDRSVFNFPSWSFTQKEYLPDSASSLSEESCSSTAENGDNYFIDFHQIYSEAREDKSYDLHSHSAKVKEIRKSHLDELDMSSPNLEEIKKNYMDGLEVSLGQGNYKCMSKQPDIEACCRSKISPAVQRTLDLDCIFPLKEFSSGDKNLCAAPILTLDTELTKGKSGSNIPVGHKSYFEFSFGNNTSSDRSNFMIQSKEPHTDTWLTEGFLPYSLASGAEQNDIEITHSVGQKHCIDNRDTDSTSIKLENKVLRKSLYSQSGNENSKETSSECQELSKRTQKASSGNKADDPPEEAEKPQKTEVSALQTYISDKVKLLDCSSLDPSEITTKGSTKEKLGSEVTIFESIAGKDFFKQGAEATMKFNSVHIHLLHKQFVWKLIN